MFASSQVDERGTNDAAPLSRGRLSAALRLALAAAAVVAVALAARRLLGRRGFSPKAWLARRRKRVAELEATRFARFRKACLSEDPQAALRQLHGWLDRAGDDAAVQTLTRFTAESGDAALAAGTRALNELLFARQPRTVQAGGRWAGRGYYELVARARRSRVAAASRASKHDGRRRADLPPTLNPASARVRRTD
jgi:hypothetical protein